MTAPEWPWGDWGPGVTLGSVVESGEKATELDFFLPPPGDLPAQRGASSPSLLPSQHAAPPFAHHRQACWMHTCHHSV